MKKITRKIIAVLLCTVAVASALSVFALAAQQEKEISPKLTYLNDYDGIIDHGTLKTVVTVRAQGKSSVTSIKIKAELQKLSSGAYSTVETWEQTFSGTSAFFEESKVTNPFSTYRLKATITAYCGSASETKTIYVYES